MTKTQTYFIILAIAIITVGLGYFLHIKTIIGLCSACLTYMKNPILPVTAAACAFIFYGSKNYWLIMAGCAVITAMTMQFIIVGQGTTVFLLASRTLAFLTVVYLMNLVKLIINRN